MLDRDAISQMPFVSYLKYVEEFHKRSTNTQDTNGHIGASLVPKHTVSEQKNHQARTFEQEKQSGDLNQPLESPYIRTRLSEQDENEFDFAAPQEDLNPYRLLPQIKVQKQINHHFIPVRKSFEVGLRDVELGAVHVMERNQARRSQLGPAPRNFINENLLAKPARKFKIVQGKRQIDLEQYTDYNRYNDPHLAKYLKKKQKPIVQKKRPAFFQNYQSRSVDQDSVQMASFSGQETNAYKNQVQPSSQAYQMIQRMQRELGPLKPSPSQQTYPSSTQQTYPSPSQQTFNNPQNVKDLRQNQPDLYYEIQDEHRPARKVNFQIDEDPYREQSNAYLDSLKMLFP